MPKHHILIWIALCIAIVPACIEPFDDGNKRQEGIIVVSGSINSEAGPYELTLGVTSRFTRITEPVSGAEVRLFDSNGLSESYFETEPGKYLCNGSTIVGTPGLAYHVEVTLETGESFASRADTMPILTGEAILKGARDTTVRNILLRADATIVPSGSDFFLRWDLVDSYYFEPTDFPDPFNTVPPPCYVDAPMFLQRSVLFDGEKNPTSEIRDLFITSREIDYSFKQLHYFLLNLNGLSREAHTFWDQVNQVVSQDGSAVDPPPAPIKGNIFNPNDPNEVVLGFFEATTLIDTSIIVFRKDDFPFVLAPFCEFTQDMPFPVQYPTICQNCLTIPFSSYQVPVWWP